MQKLKKIETIEFPTLFGDFDLTAYETNYENQPNMRYVFVITNKKISFPPTIRIHSECILSEIFKSTHCDCREQLELGLEMVAEKNGILFYLDQEGRGHGIINKIHELKKQEEGLDTVEASEILHLEVDQRSYEVVADILKEMHIEEVHLATNNPRKIKCLEQNEIKVSGRISAEVEPNKHNIKYLETKKKKLGHLLTKYIRD